MLKDKQQAMDAVHIGEAFILGANLLLRDLKGKCTHDEYEAFSKGVGISIGTVSMRLMDPLYREHPELMPLGYDLSD